ncbi:MAG: hypothetical protein JWP26_191 [Devosia sp.]|uniref:hypothetical protein n=1 Tax=Devosia sp. TaxID=1871048 RepID=UPI002630AEF4|nr:hypothetical protein [Devosia sp.]MDB5585221.1 hypothetical protein [Devosia sp.]
MAVTKADLQRILGKDDADLVEQARHPALADLTQDELRQLSNRLRERRNKANTAIANHRRAIKGRGTGVTEKLETNQRRHYSIFGEALARTNKETTRRQVQARRTELMSNAQRALSLKQAAGAPGHPGGEAHAGSGMKSNASTKTAKVGSVTQHARVSQATKTAQAKKDNRGA